MTSQVKAKAPFILVVAVAFFVYQLLILANSIEAEIHIAQTVFGLIAKGSLSGPVFWLCSELIGEVGVILRFIGTCFFVGFTAMLLFRKTFSISLLRKSVLLEGIYYLFNLPFIIYLLTGPMSNATLGAALSYAGQLLIVTPIFLKLYFTLRKPALELAQAARWLALSIISFTFALWVKHFALALYALPSFNFGDAVFAVGFANSAVTLLVATCLMAAAFMTIVRKQKLTFDNRLFGVALVLMGLYIGVFLIVSAFSPAYWTWISLVDWWIIVMPVLGISLLTQKKP